MREKKGEKEERGKEGRGRNRGRKKIEEGTREVLTVPCLCAEREQKKATKKRPNESNFSNQKRLSAILRNNARKTFNTRSSTNPHISLKEIEIE